MFCSWRRRKRRSSSRASPRRWRNQAPLLANMVEGGKTPPMSAPELQSLGFALVIFPGAIARVLAKAAGEFYASLAAHGTSEPFRARMLDFDALNELIGTPEMLALGRALFRRSRAQARGGPQAMSALDSVTLAVLNGRLIQIADEMDATLYRSAFNPIIAEAHDACHGLYHAETGATLVQGTLRPADLRRRHGVRRQGGDRYGRA